LLIFLLTFLVFGNTLFHLFTYDDIDGIKNNTLITSFRNLPLIFSHRYFSQTIEKSYRPVVTASYFLDCALWGKRPVGFHLTNVLLHAIAAVLFFMFLGRFIEAREARFFAALLFAVHPVVCEAVNSISFREDLLAGVFVLAAWLVFFHFEEGGILWAIPGAVFALFAYFSKESAIPVIFTIGLYVYLWKARHGTKPVLSARLLFWGLQIAAFLLFIIVRFLIMLPQTREVTKGLGISRIEAVAHSGFLFLKGWRLFFFPFWLNADYVFWPSKEIFTQCTIGMIFLGAYFLVFLVLVMGKKRKAAFALGWIFLFFLPVSNIVPLTNPFAERYLYLPLMGFALLGGLCYEYVFKKVREKSASIHINILRIMATVLVLFLAYLSIQRNLVWGTDAVLWTATLRREPDSVRAINGVALVRIGEEKFDEAETLLKKAARLDPSDYEVHNNLGVLYARTKRPRLALQEFSLAVRLKPDYAKAHYNLARLYFFSGPHGLKDARSHLRLAERFGYTVPRSFAEKVQNALPPK